MKRLALLPVLLVTACGTALTPAALAPSMGEVFAGLYVQQQTQQGRTDVAMTALHATAACRRTGPSPDGPGEDWTCTVQYVDGTTTATQLFEVQVKPDGCWKADAPAVTQPAQLTDATTGLPQTNPLAEFDGCLDTSWH